MGRRFYRQNGVELRDSHRQRPAHVGIQPRTQQKEAITMQTISIIGGTGSLGSGLAWRFAQAGNKVIIGSRDAERAAETATGINRKLGKDLAQGMDNDAAAAAAGDAGGGGGMPAPQPRRSSTLSGWTY